MAKVSIGRIRAAHGIKGELKVETWDRVATSLRKGQALLVEGESTPRVVVSVRPQRDWQLVVVEGVITRNQSEALVGREVFVEREALPQLAAGEFYLSDVLGFTAVTPAGLRVGKIEGTADGAQTLLIIRSPAGKEILLPCIEGFVLEIRREAREVLIDPPDGLLDL